VERFAGGLADYMAVKCRACGDAGHVRTPLRVLNGVASGGEIMACRACNPERPRGIPITRLSNTFESFNVKLNPGMGAALGKCIDLAAGGRPFVLLCGAYGTGKTHLAIAALQAVGRGAFWKVPDLLDYIRDRAFGEDGVGETAALDPIRDNTGLLVLDDLGAHKSSEWTTQALYRVLDARYDLGLRTIITTNMDVRSLDGRIMDRFAAFAVNCDGQSVRRMRAS